MIDYKGVFLPDGEVHLVDWMEKKNQIVDGKPTYQYHKLEAVMEHVRQFRSAIDVGGHCGLWSMHLVKRFRQLHAYEPVFAHRECFRANVLPGEWEGVGIEGREPSHACIDGHDVWLDGIALGEQEGRVAIRTADTSSGDSWVDGNGQIPMRRLDDCFLTDEFVDLDFIKLDCEGYELFALRGGEEILKRNRPCVIVEQKPGRAQKFGLPERGAVDYLQSLGAVLRKEISGDFILSWDPQ